MEDGSFQLDSDGSLGFKWPCDSDGFGSLWTAEGDYGSPEPHCTEIITKKLITHLDCLVDTYFENNEISDGVFVQELINDLKFLMVRMENNGICGICPDCYLSSVQ